MKTLIISGGSIDLEFARAYIKKQAFDYAIAADAGIHAFASLQMLPDEILGDFDSAGSGVLGRLKQYPQVRVHQYQPEKDATDTELALQLAIARGSSEIHILGATGTRLDHTLGNVHLLGLALERGIVCYLVDTHNRIRLIHSKTMLKKSEQYGDYISLLPLAGKAGGVTLTGFKYPLSNDTIDTFCSIGISNEMVEEEAVIDLKDGIIVLIESKD